MLVVSEKVSEKIILGLDDKTIDEYRAALGDALIKYSKNPSVLPLRTVLQSSHGSHVFMPSLIDSDEALGIKIISGTARGYNGMVIPLDDSGMPEGVISAAACTGFRTALASSLAWTSVCAPEDRAGVKCLLVLGAGIQAFYHAWLGIRSFSQIRKVIIWNRSQDRANQTKCKLQELCSHRSELTIEICCVAAPEQAVRQSQIILSCLPTTEAIIQREWLVHGQAIFLGMMGSYRPNMHEISGPDLALLLADGAQLLVDTRHGVLAESGEVIDAHIEPDRLREVGELLSGASYTPPEDCFIWKCVGLSVMDIAIGRKLLESARESGCCPDVPFG